MLCIGIQAVPNSWPAQAYLLLGQSLCGGTLISRRTVITAAHCVNPMPSLSNVLVYLGTYDRTHLSPPNTKYSVSQIIRV